MPATYVDVPPGDMRREFGRTLLGMIPVRQHSHQTKCIDGRTVYRAIGAKRPVCALGISGDPHLTGTALQT